MSLKEKIQTDVKNAMRAQDKTTLATLRLITAALKQVEVDERKQLNDDDIVSILTKLAKQRRESIEQFAKANRQDLITIEEQELRIILAYLPQPLSEEEVAVIIQAAITQSGAQTAKDMGKVMAIVKPQLQSRTDMSKVSLIIKELLNTL